MSERMKKSLRFAGSIFIIVFLLYLGGYRFDSMDAVKANSQIPKGAQLLDQVNFKWGNIYIFDTEDKPMTVISLKKLGWFWVSNTSVFHYRNQDPVRTIGGATFADKNNSASVISIIVYDPDVAYIEAGPENDRLRQEVTLEMPLTFWWEYSIKWSDLAPKAYDSEGNVLYEYRYPETNHTNQEDLKWYHVSVK